MAFDAKPEPLEYNLNNLYANEYENEDETVTYISDRDKSFKFLPDEFDAYKVLGEIRRACTIAQDAILEATQLRAENAALNKKYNELLTDSIRHGQVMMGNLLKATIDGAIHPVQAQPATSTPIQTKEGE